MGSTSKKTGAMVARIAEMNAAGVAQTEIAKREGISARSVRNYLDDIGARRPRAKRVEKTPLAPAHAARVRRSEELAAEAARTIASSDVNASTDHLRARLHQTRETLKMIYPAVIKGELNATLLKSFTEIEQNLEAEVFRQTLAAKPPDRPDPEKDPDTLEVSDRLATKIARMVERAEAKKTCVWCGKHPDRKS